MIKYFPVYTLFLMLVFHTSCGQNQTNVPQDNIKSSRANYSESQLKEADTSKVPSSMVRNVRQASNGDILIASCTGVFRYDGKSFTNITSGIPSPCFWDVLEDRKGNLWFASKDSGVYYYNGKSLPTGQAGFQHFTTKDGLASNIALHIYEDRAGNIWFATGGGASRYDGKSFRNFTTKDGLPNNGVHTIMEDKTGKLWIGSSGELCFYDGKTFTTLTNKDGKTFRNVWGIIEDKKGNIWFGDFDGLWRYNGNTFTKISQRGVYAIIEDKKGNIWTTGEVNPQVWALSRYDAKSLYNKMPTVTEIKSGGPSFLGILEANDGSIWFGALGLEIGVHRYDGKTFTDFKSKEGQKFDSLNLQTPKVVQHDIINVQHTYIPRHVKGDKDFDGECDLSSTATLKISDDQTKLYIELYFKAKEPNSDSTEASGTDTFIIFDTKDSKKKIVKILTGTMDSGRFTYRNDNELHLIFEPYTIYAEWDMINGVPGGGGRALKLKQRGLANFTKDFTKNGLVKKWVFAGDMNGSFDPGSQPKITIETNTISILVKEN